MKKVGLIVLLISLNSNVFAQKDTPTIIDFFTVYELNGKVLLSWQINSGSTCNGIQILRSTDYSNFYEIGEIAGICGSSQEAINYNYTDNSPHTNQLSFYKLELGGFGASETLEIEVLDIPQDKVIIRPHPVKNSTKIYFTNPKSKVFKISIYDSLGNKIHIDTTKENYFNIGALNLNKGAHFFHLFNEDNIVVYKGKLLVLK